MTPETLATPMIALAVPIVVAAVLGALGRWLRPVAPWLALAGPLALAGIGADSIAGERYGGMSWQWISAGATTIDAGFAIFPLSALMLAVVGVVAAMVVLFSAGYMRGDRGYARYFALLSLFTAAMAALVMADSLVTLFIGWELVGACSFLLIGFWYEKPAAAEAARKAFLVTRVGDVFFLLGIAVLWVSTGTVRITEVLATVPALPAATVTAAALLLFAGAAGKSAQFPLHVWLPDAMEGP
ncbi:MAG TPA: proton-conducting transporter membrane subunit, partial [Coriobacteriia bacterium]